jgi:hypothetical protein
MQGELGRCKGEGRIICEERARIWSENESTTNRTTCRAKRPGEVHWSPRSFFGCRFKKQRCRAGAETEFRQLRDENCLHELIKPQESTDICLSIRTDYSSLNDIEISYDEIDY